MKNLSNARYLSYDEVADTFVETNNYKRLLQPFHSLIMGPRGCGKTTMLKMLNPIAASRKQYIKDMPFWGIYIPSDQQWKSQFDAIEYQFKDKLIAKKISKAIVNINVLIAFCDTVEALWSLAEISEGADTFPFFVDIVKLWQLESPIAPSLNEIIIRLRKYLMDIDYAVSNQDDDLKFPYVCSVNFTNLLLSGIDAFEKTFYTKEFLSDKKRWAICLDEMEIAPEWLIEEVKRSMRSIDQRILFKITAVPTPALGTYNNLDATEGNDFEIIRIWNYNQQTNEDWIKFSDTMLQERILEKNNIDFENISKKITSIEVQHYQNDYRGAMNDLLSKLASVDSDFYRYLIKKEVDVSNIDISNIKKQKASFHYYTLLQRLKIKQQAKISNAMSLYYVYMNPWLLREFCDGNPRSLVNFYNELNDLFSLSRNDNDKLVNIPLFAQMLKNFCAVKVYNKLAYQSMPPLDYKGTEFSYKQTLDIIGHYLYSRLASAKYIPTPEMFFAIENEAFFPFVKKALEVGAIILIEDSSEYRGVRGNVPVYRLNYGLLPYYHIVKTNSRDVIYLDDIFDQMIENDENKVN